MAVYKCKMCGASLEVNQGETIIECEYCGVQQTLPKTTDENIQSLFNRANLLRQKNEFDKAEEIYEKIILADETEAEAYWGVILCKFGIEYVEDPKTYKRIPTCHRTSYESIVADEYYKNAIKNADVVQREIYEKEAKLIDEIQKNILAISAQEEPYDVFICYKETDETGKRTQDSVIANDIYHQLTNEGFKVFYAAITLEDKLGSAYEPIIFAALNSAKVMLAIGTKPEYFNAVWVKNEWSRFLKIMKKDNGKILIPCYKGMDAYELPEEFSHLQAQDMTKIGFINDVVRGIKKVIVKTENNVKNINETVSTSNSTQIGSLLKRVKIFLDDKEWKKANEYCEKVLDIDPENAQAYLYKFLLECEVSNLDEITLENIENSIYEYASFNKALRFADDKLKKVLSEFEDKIERMSVELENKKIALGSLVIIDKDMESEGFDFSGSTLIEEVKILEGVTRIQAGAFKNCSNLKRITMSNSVTSIGFSAFNGCSSLTTVTFEAGSQLASIEFCAFEGCSSLTSITIPNSVTSIGSSAFSECSSLTTVTFETGSQLTSIDAFAFFLCSNLTSINIPSSVTSIGENAFYKCPCEEQVRNIRTSITRPTASTTSSSTIRPTYNTSSYSKKYIKSEYVWLVISVIWVIVSFIIGGKAGFFVCLLIACPGIIIAIFCIKLIRDGF